jgi:putative SOS response-associated peptidase YedK
MIRDFQIAIGDLPSELAAPRYNIGPTSPVAVISLRDGLRELRAMRWGLTPPWRGHGGKRGPLLFNAQIESVDTKPIFRDSFKRRRCLVPADGFFEWRAVDGKKHPIWFHREDRRLFAFAGIWRDDECAILTTTPNEMVASIHDRMPVILDPSAYMAWLDPSVPPARARELCASAKLDGWRADAVGPRANSIANDDVECVALADGSPPGQLRLL